MKDCVGVIKTRVPLSAFISAKVSIESRLIVVVLLKMYCGFVYSAVMIMIKKKKEKEKKKKVRKNDEEFNKK